MSDKGSSILFAHLYYAASTLSNCRWFAMPVSPSCSAIDFSAVHRLERCMSVDKMLFGVQAGTEGANQTPAQETKYQGHCYQTRSISQHVSAPPRERNKRKDDNCNERDPRPPLFWETNFRRTERFYQAAKCIHD